MTQISLEMQAQIERAIKGEDIPKSFVEAGQIPRWYGVDTASEMVDIWLDMWRRMEPIRPDDEWFYLSNAIGWSSR